MKKRVIFIVVTALLCCLLVACGSKTRLQAPQNIRQNGPFLIWDEVKNAEGYIVLADNEEYVTAEPSCNLSFLGGETVYVVKIKAVGDGENFADSDWSEFGFNEIFKYTLLADGSGYEVNLSVSSVELQDKKVVVPSTYENLPVTRIADKMFYKCASLTEVVLPNTLKEIGANAFYNCDALESIELPESVTAIGSSAFSGCLSLKKIVVPDGIERIEGNMFGDCTSLTEVVLPSTLKEIRGMAFLGCIVLENIELPESVTAIGSIAFGGCSSLKKIVVPTGVERIEGSTFVGCSNLTEVVLPSTLKEIMGMAFRNCEALKTVVLPSSLKDIGKGAFSNCPLESVFFGGTEAEYLSVSVAEGNDSILSAAVYFYSETEPTENPQKFWRYSGGKPLPWA